MTTRKSLIAFFAFTFASLLVVPTPASAYAQCVHYQPCTVGGSPVCGAVTYVFHDANGNPVILITNQCCSCI